MEQAIQSQLVLTYQIVDSLNFVNQSCACLQHRTRDLWFSHKSLLSMQLVVDAEGQSQWWTSFVWQHSRGTIGHNLLSGRVYQMLIGSTSDSSSP